MTWTQAIADSLGVADEGLRLILGQLSGKTFFKKKSYFFLTLKKVWNVSFCMTIRYSNEYQTRILDLINNSLKIKKPVWKSLLKVQRQITKQWLFPFKSYRKNTTYRNPDYVSFLALFRVYKINTGAKILNLSKNSHFSKSHF